MIAIIDYDAGNMRSVKNALAKAGAEFIVTSDPEAIRAADKVILPGVGEAATAMGKLRERGLDKVIPSLRQPVLGICIGLQLMCKHSEEGDADCLGIFDTQVRRFADEPGLKIPHMGWNTISFGDAPIFDSLRQESFVYYVHSFAPDVCDDTIATTTYGSRTFSAAIQKGNFIGTQFHPEKSGPIGALIIKNFLQL